MVQGKELEPINQGVRDSFRVELVNQGVEASIRLELVNQGVGASIQWVLVKPRGCSLLPVGVGK